MGIGFIFGVALHGVLSTSIDHDLFSLEPDWMLQRILTNELSQISTKFTNTPVVIADLEKIDIFQLTPTIKPTHTPFQPQSGTATWLPTPTASQTPAPTATSTTKPTKTPTPTPTLPTESHIMGIYGKFPAFSLSCESRSAVDWAAYFGVQISEINFFQSLPLSDNPDKGFVGSVYGAWGQIPPRDYGVHAKPVAKLLRNYGLNARAVRGMTWEALRGEIAAGRPVIVWVVGRVGRGTPVPYTAADGRETVVARFEHTIIVIGYTEHRVTVLDGSWVYSRRWADFLESWSVLGNMAVIMED
jgi:uncharacterized protein YvpB